VVLDRVRVHTLFVDLAELDLVGSDLHALHDKRERVCVRVQFDQRRGSPASR
jgi:hypothetical protein